MMLNFLVEQNENGIYIDTKWYKCIPVSYYEHSPELTFTINYQKKKISNMQENCVSLYCREREMGKNPVQSNLLSSPRR